MILDRLRMAWQVVMKGAWFPFNRVPVTDGGGGEKLSEPYKQSPWVQRAIKMISGPISAVPLNFTDTSSGEPVEDPAMELFWRQPAIDLTLPDFIEAFVGWMKLKGESFWVLDDTWLQPFMEPNQREKLLVVRPDRMRPIVQRGLVIGWEYTDGNGDRHALLPQQVIHIKNWNPYDPIRGLGEMQAAQLAAESDYLAGTFNRNLMRNNGDQGVYVIGKNGIPTDDQRNQIIQQLLEKREASQRGYYRPVFITGDISIEDPKVQAPDANFVANRLHNRHEIFIAFGVPPSMADVVASYSIGSASDRFILIEETCMPMAAKLCSGIDQVLAKQAGRSILSAFDWDEHSVMQQVRRERVDSAVKLWGLGMPMEQVSEYLGLDLPEFEGWDVGYLPFSVAPVNGSLPPDHNNDYAEIPSEPGEDQGEDEETGTNGDEAIQEMFRALKCEHRGETPPAETENVFQRERPAKEVAQWRELMAKRRDTVKAYEVQFNKALMRARREVLAKLAAPKSLTPTLSHRMGEGGAQQRAAAADFLFSLVDWKASFLTDMRKVAATALQTSGKQLFQELGKDDPFTMAPEKVLQFVKGRENKLSGVGDDVFGRIKDTIQEGFDKGDTMQEIAGRVKAEFNDISRGRAMVIAQTETAAAYGAGRSEAMREAGVQYKRWLTSGNPNVRPAHADANGQVVGIDEPYMVGGEELMHPGDPSGSPENVINCHCVSIAVEGASAPPQEE